MSQHGMHQTELVSQFTCLGAECEDTCCKGWGMQLDQGTKEKYEKEAPELLDAVTSGESEWIMKRDPSTDYCVKYSDGLCGIHGEKGTDFLGDACHFYPRITRKIGNTTTMTAALSCPEIARIALYSDNAFTLSQSATERLPYSLKAYGEPELNDENMLSLAQNFITVALDETASPERNLSRIFTFARALLAQPTAKWPNVIETFTPLVDLLTPPAEVHFADSYRLLNMLVALEAAAPQSRRSRLNETISAMEQALGIFVNRKTMQIEDKDSGNFSRHKQLDARWEHYGADAFAPVLRRYIAAQLSMASFPFSGFGEDISERCTILGVRFATIKLALASHVAEDGALPDEETTIRIIQSISRFLDHLADPQLSLQGYKEAGWHKPARIRSLIGDVADNNHEKDRAA